MKDVRELLTRVVGEHSERDIEMLNFSWYVVKVLKI